MLIRSQDKKNLTNFEQLTDLAVMKLENGFRINAYYAFSVGDDYAVMGIGEYSTEEKALKVLDMIEQAYCKSFEEQKQNYFGHRYDLIFHMPKDEEVEE